MKKITAVLCGLFLSSAIYANDVVDFIVPAGYIASEHGVDRKAFQLVTLSNGSQVGNSLHVAGSLISRDYTMYNAVAILVRIDGKDVDKVPLTSPGFTFDVDMMKQTLGVHSLELYAIGQGTSGSSDPIERLFAASIVEITRVPQMTPGGWIFMIAAWIAILSLNVFAFTKIFGIKESKIVEPLELDTEQ